MILIVKRKGARRVMLFLPLLAIAGIVGACRDPGSGPGKSTITVSARVSASERPNAPKSEVSLSYDCDCFVSQLNTDPLANRVLRAEGNEISQKSASSIPMDVTEIGMWLGGSNNVELEKAVVKYRCTHAGFGFEVCKK